MEGSKSSGSFSFKFILENSSLYCDAIDELLAQFQHLKITGTEISQFFFYATTQSPVATWSADSDFTQLHVMQHKELYSECLYNEAPFVDFIRQINFLIKNFERIPIEFTELRDRLEEGYPMVKFLNKLDKIHKWTSSEDQISFSLSVEPKAEAKDKKEGNKPNEEKEENQRKKALQEKKKRKKLRKKLNKQNQKNKTQETPSVSEEKEWSGQGTIFKINDLEFEQVLSNFQSRLNSHFFPKENGEKVRKKEPLFHSEFILMCETSFKNLSCS